VLAATPLWERLVVLAPVIVVGTGIVIGTFLLLGRALAQNVRESGHKRLIYLGFVLLLGAVGLLTYLGVELPREGG
jgi:hypothetical protein